MSKPIVHAKSSAKRFGGKPEDYLDIHQFLDSSRQSFSDLRHRALTHNSWFITTVLPKVFGESRTNSEDKVYSVTEVGERHVHEDFGRKFIPTAQDYLQQIVFQPWMENGKGEPPASAAILKKPKATKKVPPAPTKISGIERLIRQPQTLPEPSYPRHARRPCNFD